MGRSQPTDESCSALTVWVFFFFLLNELLYLKARKCGLFGFFKKPRLSGHPRPTPLHATRSWSRAHCIGVWSSFLCSPHRLLLPFPARFTMPMSPAGFWVCVLCLGPKDGDYIFHSFLLPPVGGQCLACRLFNTGLLVWTLISCVNLASHFNFPSLGFYISQFSPPSICPFLFLFLNISDFRPKTRGHNENQTNHSQNWLIIKTTWKTSYESRFPDPTLGPWTQNLWGQSPGNLCI